MKARRTTEDYVKVIYLLSQTDEEVHACQICRKLNLSRPTVSVALRRMEKEGYLTIKDTNAINLTAQGTRLARSICEKYRLLRDALLRLGVSLADATRDACQMEHDISDATSAALKKFLAQEAVSRTE